jgi:hypothetical protein
MLDTDVRPLGDEIKLEATEVDDGTELIGVEDLTLDERDELIEELVLLAA